MSLSPDVQALRSWLVWRYVQRPGEPKPRKVPYYAGGGVRKGKQGAPKDRAQLVTFAEAQAAARDGYNGVGLAMLPDNGLVALDFDGCIDEAGRLDPTVARLVAGTYAERSPSGKGVRAFMRGSLPDNKQSANAAHAFGFETFHGKGFVTVTGDLLPDCELLGADVAPLTDAVRDYAALRFGRPEAPAAVEPVQAAALSATQLRDLLARLDPSCGYDPWLKTGMSCHSASGGQMYGLDVWDEWSSQDRDKYPGRDVLEAKWASFSSDGSITGDWLKSQAGQVAAAEDFEDLSGTIAARFAFEPAATFAARPLPPWLIKDVLPQAGLAVIYGASGSGKTFLTLDLAAAVALGLPWRGRRVRKGKVAYLVAEGAAGFAKRLRAYTQEHGHALGDAIVVHGGAPNLLLPADTAALIEALKAAGPLSVVVIDTAAQVTPGGNENASEDMGRLVANCRKIHEATGALVLLVHHSGKDASKGARGWSGLRAAADAEIEVTRDEQGVRTASLSKQKDAADGDRYGFTLRTVEVGRDEDGDPITSCVVEPCEAPERKPGRPGEGLEGKTQWQLAYDAVRVALLVAEGGQLTGSEALDVIMAAEPWASLDSSNRRSRATRARDTAIEKGALHCAAGIITLG